MYKLLPATDDKLLFFSMMGEADERHGVIGHLRADFGGGREFHHTWFDHQSHLKTQAFKSEFDELFNTLRNDGKAPPLANRANMAIFNNTTSGLELGSQGKGYFLRTSDFSYYFRLLPKRGEYDIYCYAYDNCYLLPELAGKHTMPDVCYSTLPSTGELITLTLNEKGYIPCDASKPNPEENRFFADTSNKIFGVTRGQEEAMLSGSMFGWDTPAAKPWNYDQNGKPRLTPPKKNEPER